MDNVISFFGKISSDGKLVFRNRKEVTAFLDNNRGKNFFITFETHETGPNSPLLKAYYENHVLIEAAKGFKEIGESYTIDRVDEILRQSNPVTNTKRKNDSGKWEVVIKQVEELGNNDMLAYLEFCKRYLAEHLNVYINDPQSLLN